MSPHCDLDFEPAKQKNSQDAQAHGDVSPYHLWLQNSQRFRRWARQTSIDIFNIRCAPDLEYSYPLFSQDTLETKFGCKKISNSGDIVETVKF